MKINTQNEQQSFDILPYYKRLTMDIICACGFGLETNMQFDYSNEFLKYSNEVFELDDTKRTLGILSILIPELHFVFRFMHRKLNELKYILQEYVPLSQYFHLKQDPIIWLTNKTYNIIVQRLETKDSAKVHKDLLQILLDSVSQNESETAVSKRRR
jgi:hypothetical protein